MKQKKNSEYKTPQISKFVFAVCEKYNLDQGEVVAFLLDTFPELKNKKKCVNCQASMCMYEHSIDSIDALLLFGMGKIVGKKANIMPFTQANRVHIQSELNQYYSVPSRTTWCSKLGLVAKIIRKDGTHDQKAGWCITKRGFEFLSGKPVPKRVQTFRNEITERFEDMTTFAEVLRTSDGTDEGKELRTHGNYKFDRLEVWAVTGFAQGALL